MPTAGVQQAAAASCSIELHTHPHWTMQAACRKEVVKLRRSIDGHMQNKAKNNCSLRLSLIDSSRLCELIVCWVLGTLRTFNWPNLDYLHSSWVWLEKDGGQRKKAGDAVDLERAPKGVVIGTIFGSVRD